MCHSRRGTCRSLTICVDGSSPPSSQQARHCLRGQPATRVSGVPQHDQGSRQASGAAAPGKTGRGRGPSSPRRSFPSSARCRPIPSRPRDGGEEGATYPALVRAPGRRPLADDRKCRLSMPPADRRAAPPRGDARVVSRHQERYIDGALWSLQTSYYPLRWVDLGRDRAAGAENLTEGAVDHLARTHRPQAGWLPGPGLGTTAQRQRAHGSSTSRTTTRVLEVYRMLFAEDETPIGHGHGLPSTGINSPTIRASLTVRNRVGP